MEIESALSELEAAIEYINENYGEADEFKMLNYLHGDSRKTGQVIVVTHYDQSGKLKYRMSESKLKRLCNSFVDECELPDADDRKVNYMIDFITDKSENVKSRLEIVEFLRYKAAALSIKAWITSKLKYSFNNDQRKCVKVERGQRDGIFFILLAAVDLAEDGLILTIKDQLDEYLGIGKDEQENENPNRIKPESGEKAESNEVSQEISEDSENQPDNELTIELSEINLKTKQEQKSTSEGNSIASAVDQDKKQPNTDKNEATKVRSTIEDHNSNDKDGESINQAQEEPVKPKVRRPGGFFGPVIKTEEELREENRDLWTKYHDSQKEIQTLNEEIDILKNDLVKSKLTVSENNNLINSQKERIAEQNGYIEALKEQIDNLNYDIFALEDTIADKNDEIGDLQEKNRKLIEENRKLTDDLQSARGTLDNTAKELQQLKINTVKDQDDVDLKISELEMKITEVKAESIAEANELNNQIKELRHVIDNKNAEIRDLKEQIAE